MSFTECTINSKGIKANLDSQLLLLLRLPCSKLKPEREPKKRQEVCLKKITIAWWPHTMVTKFFSKFQ